MADIAIQFWATEQAFGEWIKQWIEFDDVVLVAMTFQPFGVKQVDPQAIPRVVGDRTVRRHCFVASPPILDVQYKTDFEDANPDALVLDIGHLSEDGLYESWLACRTDNLDALAKWRQIAKVIKVKTKAGVTAINRQNGISAFYRSFRYSEGAKDLESNGVTILTFRTPDTDGPEIRLGKIYDAPDADIDA
ncbi:MAG: hypothetical protein R3C10_23490 [Pirellulales bacterium]